MDAAAAEIVSVGEEGLVNRDAAVRVGVDLGHPSADPVRVELVVPCPVE
jgi:hypothetical protein